MDERADALYELPPGEFVAARDRLAKELKAEGQVKAANEVKGLRRPTVVAATLNAIARQHPGEIEALLDAGRRLAEASGTALKEASRVRRYAVQAIVRRVPDAHRDGVAATLEAALVDDAVAADLQAGRLTKEADAPAVFGFGTLPVPADEPEPKSVDLAPYEREVEEAKAAVDEAKAEVTSARRALEEAEARLGEAKERADAAAEALREAGSGG